MISYTYPPNTGGGVLRVLKFSKYLQRFDWKPYVISINKKISGTGAGKVPSGIDAYYTKNILPLDVFFSDTAKKMNAEITSSDYGINRKSIRVNLFKHLKTIKTFFIPDVQVGWIPLTYNKAKKVIESEDIDIIYATCPPPSALLIGALLKKTTGKPLVVDFRDPWIRNLNLEYITPWNRFLESYVMKNSDYVLVNRPSMLAESIADHPFIKDKIILLSNGFDLSDLPKKNNTSKKFSITYMGTFGATRSPILFLKAVKNIVEENKIPREELQVLFIGSDSSLVDEFNSKNGLDDVVKQTDYMPQKKALKIVFKSHMLLLIEFSDSYPGKVFEYLSSGIPILAIITKGQLSNLIKEYSENSHMIYSNDVKDVEKALVEGYKKWKTGEKISLSDKTKKFKENYNREHLTEKLSEIFLKVSK